jgi:4-amino-4-deoxy-L-arabinose transferase-like glycosyltransferase
MARAFTAGIFPPMHDRPRRFAQSVAVVAACGGVLRLVDLLTVARHTVGIGDWWFYHWQANLIADGRGFLDPFQLLEHREAASAGHPPLYPLLLAGMSKLGLTTTLWHRSAGVVLGMLAIVLIALIGRRVAGPSAGLVAAIVAAIYPIFIGADADLMSETLYGPFVAGGVLTALALRERPRAATAALLGALIALAALTRSEALLLMPLLALPLAWAGGRDGRALRLVAVVAACVVVLAPWTIRNLSTFDRFVPLTTNDATVIAGANCGFTYHGVDLGGWSIACISKRSERDESVQAAKWRSEGIDYAKDHAGRLPVAAAVRFLRVWDFWQPRRQVEFAEGRQRNVEQAGVAMYFLLLPLALYGFLAVRDPWMRWILVSPFVMVALTAIGGYGVPRLRHAAEIPLVVLAGIAIPKLWARVAERRSPRPTADVAAA